MDYAIIVSGLEARRKSTDLPSKMRPTVKAKTIDLQCSFRELVDRFLKSHRNLAAITASSRKDSSKCEVCALTLNRIKHVVTVVVSLKQS